MAIVLLSFVQDRSSCLRSESLLQQFSTYRSSYKSRNTFQFASMFKIFSPNILVAAVLALLAGLADLASAQGIYQDFSVTSVNFAARVVLTDFFGGVEAGKATCDQTPNCIGVVDGELV